jgi:hypothetical protein
VVIGGEESEFRDARELFISKVEAMINWLDHTRRDGACLPMLYHVLATASHNRRDGVCRPMLYHVPVTVRYTPL